MIRSIYSKIYLLIFVVLVSACTEQFDFNNTKTPPNPKTDFQDIEVEPLGNREPLTGSELLAIAMEMQQGGNEFNWDKVDDFTLWSAVVRGDSTISIGFENRAALGLNSKNQTIDFILEYTKSNIGYGGSADELKRRDFNTIDVVVVKINDYLTIGRMRKLPFVRYVEPWGFSLEAYMDVPSGGRIQSGFGCGEYGTSYSSTAYTLLPGTNSAISWHLTAHKVDAAWAYGTGSGTTIGIIDTGILGSQALLSQSGFNWDSNSPRTIEQFNNNGNCQHGTTVTGMIAGPVNSGLAITGVAHRANVKAYRAGIDVHLNTPGEKQNLVNALDQFTADPAIKVINISLGYLFFNSSVSDAVIAAKYNNKLVICSAGSTDFFGLGTGIYPARHSSTIAVTGVKYDPAGDPLSVNLEKFGGNFNGSFVDFATHLERKSDGQRALGMHHFSNERVKAKGSSAAAALVSGIAALVWEQDPSLSRAQVINILKNAASIYVPFGGRDAQYGWGAINAQLAVVLAKYGFLYATISGPSSVNTLGTKYWTANVANATGSIQYAWYWNGSWVGGQQTYARGFNSITQATVNLKLVVTTSVGQEDEFNKTIYIGYGKGGGGPQQ